MINAPTKINDPEQLARHQAALAVLLESGKHFTTASAEPVTAEELRGWISRVGSVARQLADYLEGPARAAVIELLGHDSLDGTEIALTILRVNIAGASFEDLGKEIGLSGATIRRIEASSVNCNVSTAKRLADRFGLRVLELFQDNGDDLVLATVQQLRDALSAA